MTDDFPPPIGTILVEGSSDTVPKSRARTTMLAEILLPENEGWRLYAEDFAATVDSSHVRTWHCRLTYTRDVL